MPTEIVRPGAVVICAADSPYRGARNDEPAIVGSCRFIEIFVDTPFEVCQSRAVKSVYARARRGDFTGIGDRCEAPL